MISLRLLQVNYNFITKKKKEKKTPLDHQFWHDLDSYQAVPKQNKIITVYEKNVMH